MTSRKREEPEEETVVEPEAVDETVVEPETEETHPHHQVTD